MSSSRPSSLVDWLLLLLLAIPLFYQLGSYPSWWDSVVGFALEPQVAHVLEGRPLEVVWRWQDMYQHNAGSSPIYSAVAETGLRTFGLELLAVRLPFAVLGWLALVFAYFQLRPWVSGWPLRLWAILWATSSWYLLFSRSGGILALSLTLVLLAGGGLLGLARLKRDELVSNVWIHGILGLLVGLAVGLLPYAHTSTRILAVAAVLTVPWLGRVFSLPQRVGFVLGLVFFLSLQLAEPAKAKAAYFNARGETIFQAMKERTDGTPPAMRAWAWDKLQSNIRGLGRFYLGLNSPNEGFWANEARSYWRGDIVLYPRYLVPFFVVGFFATVGAAFRDPRGPAGWLVAYGGITVLPGLLTGVGEPNAARLLLHAPFVYACIAAGLSPAWSRFGGLPRARPLAAVVVALAVGFQVYNFFGYTKGSTTEMEEGSALLSAVRERLDSGAEVKVALHTTPEFEHTSYVVVRWLGRDWLRLRREEGRVHFFDEAGEAWVRAEVAKGETVYLVTSTLGEARPRLEGLPWVVERLEGKLAVLRLGPARQ